jgi:hypothetical protein
LRVRDGAVVGLLEVAVRGERVGDAGARGLDELVVQGVEETLQGLLEMNRSGSAWHSLRTGPVRVLLDLVLHVPTNSLGHVPCAVVRAARPATPAREYFMIFVVIAGIGLRCWWCMKGCCLVFASWKRWAWQAGGTNAGVVVAILLPK